MHTVITCPEWEEEFNKIKFDSSFPPKHIYPNEETRIEFVLNELKRIGFLKYSFYETQYFESYRRIIHNSFKVPWSMISRPLERFLFAIASSLLPKVTVVIGCASGVDLSFLATALETINSYYGKNIPKVMGIDTDPYLIALAKSNINILNLTNVLVNVFMEDAHLKLESLDCDIDLLFIDAEGVNEEANNRKGKNIYESLIKKAIPRLHSGSIVIAHDIRWASLSGEVTGYLNHVRNPKFFLHSVEVRMDIQGIEVSLK